MHELSLITDLFEQISSYISDKNTVTSVHVTLGCLAGIDKDSFEHIFYTVAQLEGYNNATLKIVHKDIEIRCASCNCNYSSVDIYTLCPQCNSFEKTIISGNECKLDSIEVEETNVH